MLISTYQHDYVSPSSRRYDFLKRMHGDGDGATAVSGKCAEACHCKDDPKVATPPQLILEKCPEVEWTGIAPMGRLVEPRIIPTKLTPEQQAALGLTAEEDCFKMQPNRFLKILRTAYPDLYERLKQLPKDELQRRMDSDRLLTTYMIDFCGANEYPDGIYESLKSGETSKEQLKESKLLNLQGPCAKFRSNIMEDLAREEAQSASGMGGDPCIKSHKPMKISFTDSTRFISSGDNSHWRASTFSKKANFSEYMDTINKSGCVIMRNNIHDHSKCIRGKHCRHQLTHTCANLM